MGTLPPPRPGLSQTPPSPSIPTICFILILQHSKLWYPWGSLNIAMVQKI